MSNYFEQLTQAKNDVIDVLKKKGIQERYLSFGGPGDPPERKPTVPTDARSEFLANRAMGDWAENLVATAIHSANSQWKSCHYGNTEQTAAGENGFKEMYLAGLEEVRLFGKRPDLLVVPESSSIPDDVCGLSREECAPVVGKSIAAIEVRSSKFKALQYMAVRAKEKSDGIRSGRDTPSFTVKVEDLKIVFRWIENHKISQCYAQVFFDCVWGINVLDIFRTIGSGKGFTIETPEKSQLKSTIMIPITSGIELGRMTKQPSFEVETRETRLGRIDAYVKPVGGNIVLSAEALKKVLLGNS